MVPRGAGAAGPVLLACRQWDPLGLARRLPSLGVGAWRSVPLLPWRVQCPVCVCAALVAGSGGSGRYLVWCLSRFPLPAPRVPRCVWQTVLSGCPLPSLAGTPFHAVCAFRKLCPVALLVVPACPLRVCELPLPRRPLPRPWVVWHAHLARSRHRALVGMFHVVRAPPRVLPRSLAPSGVLGGRAVRSRFPPTWLGAVRPPWGGCVVFVCRGAGWGGGGGGPCAVPPVCVAGGASRAGGRSASFPPPAFPGQATKRLSLASFWSWGSYSCSPRFPGRDLCGVLARWRVLACSPQFLWEPAAGPWGRAVLRLLPRAGGWATIPPALGGSRPAPLRLASRWGGEVAPRPPCSPSWGQFAVPYPVPPLVLGALPPRLRVRSGSRGRPGGGGDEGRPVDRSTGAPSDLNPPSALPEWAMVMGRVMGGAAPILVWCSAVCRPKSWSARRSGALVWARPSAAAPAGAGCWWRWGARCAGPAASPPPRVAVPSGGGGASPRLRGGGGSLLWLSSWGEEQGRGCAAAPRPPALSGINLPSVVSGAPPRAILVPWGCWAAVGARRGPVGRHWLSAAWGGGGGGNPPALVRAPAYPRQASERAAPFAPSCAPPVRRRSAAGRAGACGRFTGGACRGRGATSVRVRRPLWGGRRAAVSSVCLRPLLGLRGRGGEWGGPSGPRAPPPDGRGGVAWRSRLQGTAVGWRVALFPRPPLPRVGPSCRPSLGPYFPLAVAARRWSARGAVRVSGQRSAGCGAVGSPPRSLSPPSLPREVARAPLSRRIVGGAWVGGPSSPPHSLTSPVWDVTCDATCVGAGAVAVAGCAGGSASG